MHKVDFIKDQHDVFICQDYDPEIPGVACPGMEANLVIVEKAIAEGYVADPDDPDDDPEDFDGIEGLWDEYNDGSMSKETMEGVQVVPMSEVIQFYLDNNRA